MKLSVDEQKTLIPDEEIRAAFIRRADVRDLPSDEREQRWCNHLTKVDKFRALISKTNSVVVTGGRTL